ncbi:sensor histidine kinase [Paenibacillus guangzhouensis]|uniref:sensor histidine kinase n=1 Tax=Paenibacillus guangzhouensis TaxID=1473112 RepID=UPI00187BC12A|nr:histidine kinase [Paenibacillus guangzhouensis]
MEDYVLAKQKLYNKFMTDIGYYSMINTLFVYSKPGDDLLIVTQENGRYLERYQMVKNYISQNLDQMPLRKFGWQFVRLNDNYFLVQMKDLGSEMYAGCLIDVNSLAIPLSTWDVGEGGGTIILADGQLPLTQKFLPQPTYVGIKNQLKHVNHLYQNIRDDTNHKEYLVVGESSQVANIHYLVVVAEKNILRNLPYLEKTINFLPFGVVLVLALYLAYLQKIFIKPMTHLLHGMRKIGRGQFDVRLNEKHSVEFSFLISNFNDMVKQIEYLKISIYEEKIRVQQAEFRHLQVQINPHFYMNCLNIIYNLAAHKDYKSVKKMALHLADYFRNLIRTDRNSIMLAEEIEHIRNYLEIQVMRYPDSMTFIIEFDPLYQDYQLPPLILQPFVENAVIHGYQQGSERFYISINILADPDDPQHYFIVVISDNGKGFSPTMLQQLNSGHYAEQTGNGHLGIWNVLRRLRMNYSTAKIHFSNGEQTGANIRIHFPLQRQFVHGDGSNV